MDIINTSNFISYNSVESVEDDFGDDFDDEEKENLIMDRTIITKADYGLYQNLKHECKHDAGTCPICCDDFNDINKVILLKCGHLYHDECIKKCIFHNPKCPLCREKIELTLELEEKIE